MKKFLISILLIFNIAHATPITLDQSEIVSGQGMKASTFQSIFTAIENAINNLISKQEVTHVFRGQLSNRTEIVGTNGAFSKFAEHENTSSLIFVNNQSTDGSIKILESGIISIDYHQDVQHSCTYAYINIYKNNTVLISSLNGKTTRPSVPDSEFVVWDGLSASISTQVAKDDLIKFELKCASANFSNVDNGQWGAMSIKWHGVMP